jgi:hypothetical protein
VAYVSIRRLVIAVIGIAAGCAPAASRSAANGLSELQLRAHLFAFAHDSMLGRRGGTEGGLKASRYIADRLVRAGLRPGGENGTFYQSIPLVRKIPDTTSLLSVGAQPLMYGRDFLPTSARWRVPRLDRARVVFLGERTSDTTGWPPRESLRGKVVLFYRASALPPAPTGAAVSYLANAAAILLASSYPTLPAVAPTPVTALAIADLPDEMRAVPPVIWISQPVADSAIGRTVANAPVGFEGRTVSGEIRMLETTLPAHNIIAILEGGDLRLRGQYVAIGAHPDHIGTTTPPLDHDSLRAALWVAAERRRALGRPLTRDERSGIAINVDTLRRSGPRRADSVNNGADDDGSGSMVVLALAEGLARIRVAPRRSIIFVWHHAEELGLMGSRFFTDHPTVPRDSIVAQINFDMVGRGSAADIVGGGPRYVQVVGSRRLSSELGNLLEAVNRRLAEPMTFDYALDAGGHPERIYCRSDHYMYARYGIPVVFLTTGLHPDYHQLTDEPQYIDYVKLRRVGELARAFVLDLANRDERPVLDKPRPDPFAECRQ